MIKEKSKTWALISAQLGFVFGKLPLSPNFYTWLTLPIAIMGLIANIYQHIWWGTAFFLAAGLFDLIDGAVARNQNRTSNFGAFLDGSLDRFIDFLLIFSYFWLTIQVPWLTLGQWLFFAIFFAIMPSFEVAYANHRRAVNDPEEKRIWRILNRGEMYTLMLLIPILANYNALYAGYLLVFLVMLSVITTLQTLYITLRLADK